MAEINGIEPRQYPLSYDKILKNTLTQSNELTIRFINGLFGDTIPLDAPVSWLDKESVNNKHVGLIADFYPQIAGRLYHLEMEQADNGDMAVRVFKYSLGGAILHGMTATDAELTVTFPQPCVIFLKSSKNTPTSLKWNIHFFDGQKVTLQIPTIKLAELSVKDIADHDLLPIGQFYMRTFEPLTKNKVEEFRVAAASLLTTLKEAIERKVVPYQVGLEMQETIRKTLENTISKSREEISLVMETDIVETLPWIDFGEVFTKLEERGRAEGLAEGIAKGKAEGKAEGKTELEMEISLKAFSRVNKDIDFTSVTRMLEGLGISKDVIEAARQQIQDKRTQAKNRESRER